jgi:hypothetical protein
MDSGTRHKIVEWARLPWVRRAAIAAYVVMLLGLTGVYIGISRFQVQTSLYLKGQTEFSTSYANPVRGIALDAPTGRKRTDVEVGLRLVPRQGSSDDARSVSDANSGRQSPEALRRALDRAIGGQNVVAKWSLEPNARGLIEGECTLPDSVSPGDHWLYVTLTSSSIDSFVARRAIQVVDRQPSPTAVPDRSFRLDKQRRSEVEDGTVVQQNGPIAADLLPPDGVVARGLKSEVLIRTYRKETGEPVAARVEFKNVTASAGQAAGRAPNYESLETNELGVASIAVDPVGDQRWTLELTPVDGEEASAPSEQMPADPEPTTPDGAEAVSTTSLDVTTVPSQTALQLESSVLQAGPNTSRSARQIRGQVASLFRVGRMFADLYIGTRWIGASSSPISDYTSRLVWHIPTVTQPTLFRTQVHRDLFVPASAWDAHYVAALPDRSTQTVGQAVRDVFDRLQTDALASSEHADTYNDYVLEHIDAWSSTGQPGALQRDELVTLLDAGLRALPRHFQTAEPLFNTQKGDRQALETWIDQAQSDLLWLTGLALMIALVGLGAVVVVEVRKRRRHAEDMRDVDLELDEVDLTGADTASADASFDAPAAELPSTGSSWLEVLLTAVVLGTFVLFAVGLLLVLTYM